MSDEQQILCGASLERMPNAKYTDVLAFAELQFRPPLTKPAVIRKWRREASDTLRTAILAPYTCIASEEGALRMNESLETFMQWLVDAAEAAKAEIIVVATPADVTPGSKSRTRLKAYFTRLREMMNEDIAIAWQPSGPWESMTAHEFALKENLVLVCDPFTEPELLQADQIYFRPKAMGIRARLSEGLLFELADLAIQYGAKRSYIALESQRAFTDAKNLQRIFDEEI